MADYVSRQAVIDYLMENMNWYDEDERIVDDFIYVKNYNSTFDSFLFLKFYYRNIVLMLFRIILSHNFHFPKIHSRKQHILKNVNTRLLVLHRLHLQRVVITEEDLMTRCYT